MEVVAAVLTQKNRFLLTRRPDHKSHGGLWEFPGGKVKQGETNKQALVRELMEELNVRVKEEELDYIGSIQSDKIHLHFFKTPLPAPYSPQEHPATAWANLDEALKKDLCPTDRKALEQFESSFRL